MTTLEKERQVMTAKIAPILKRWVGGMVMSPTPEVVAEMIAKKLIEKGRGNES